MARKSAVGRTDFVTVDDYLASFPQATRARLEQLRAIVRAAVPEAEEIMSYAMPAYRLHGTIVIYFAGWKNHYSLYPLSAGVAKAFETELTSYEARKGTIRFALSEPVPAELIERIARFRAAEVGELRSGESDR